jgi:FAD/FMN-containing dehydrogenase
MSTEIGVDAATDFGGVCRLAPAAVSSPKTSSELSWLVTDAARAGKTVVVRGTGHSQGGQCLNEGGRVISTQGLRDVDAIDVATSTVTVGAGVCWREVVKQTLAAGLLPPVLTDNLDVSVGGTLAVGGVGPASFRAGLQLHHCDGFEAVLGSGEVRWFGRQSPLFGSILGGLGRLGIITRARLQLRPCSRQVHVTHAQYHSLQAFLIDAQSLLGSALPTYLSGGAYPSASGGHRFVLRIGVESSSSSPPGGELRNGLGCDHAYTTRHDIAEYATRFERTFESEPFSRSAKDARPWVEYLLPLSAVTAYVALLLSEFPSTPLLLWPLRTEGLRWPSFALPNASEMILVGLLVRAERAQLPQVLSCLKRISRIAETLGGKRYLSGWLDFDQDDWLRHYGAYWNERQRLRAQVDPASVFRELPHWSAEPA